MRSIRSSILVALISGIPLQIAAADEYLQRGAGVDLNLEQIIPINLNGSTAYRARYKVDPLEPGSAKEDVDFSFVALETTNGQVRVRVKAAPAIPHPATALPPGGLSPGTLPHEIHEFFAKHVVHQKWPVGTLVESAVDARYAVNGLGYSVDAYFGGEADFQAYGLTGHKTFRLQIDWFTLDGMTFRDRTWMYVHIIDWDRPPVLAIRGTSSVRDAWSDTNPNGVGYDQFMRNRDQLDRWLRAVSEPFRTSSIPNLRSLRLRPHITGHSLGGALTQWVAAAYTASGWQLSQIVTFNSPGIPRSVGADGVDAFVPENAQSVTHYIASGDPVSMGGEAYLPPAAGGNLNQYNWVKFIYLKKQEENQIKKHSHPLLMDSRFEGGEWLLNPMRYPHPDFRPIIESYDTVEGTLSAPYFSYLPSDPTKSGDPDWKGYLAAFNKVGGAPLTAALTFRVSAEAARREIGLFLASVGPSPQYIIGAAQRWKPSAWIAILNMSRKRLGLPPLQQLNKASGNDIVMLSSSGGEEGYWEASNTWPELAWQSSVSWDCGWGVMSELWAVPQWTRTTVASFPWQATTTWQCDKEWMNAGAPPPATITITSPASGAPPFPLGQAIPVTVSAPSDATEVRLQVTPGASPAADLVSPWSFNWTPAGEGTYTLRAVAFLASGDIASSSPPTSVTVSNTPVTLNVAFSYFVQNGAQVPPQGAKLRPDADIWVVTYVDHTGPTLPVVGLKIRRPNGTYLPTKSPDSTCPDISKGCTFTWPSNEQAPGAHMLELTATLAGKTATATLPVTLDAAANEETVPITADAFLRRIKRFRGNYKTRIPTSDYVCSVVGFAARGGNIGEGYTGPMDIIEAYLYRNKEGNQPEAWNLRSEFLTEFPGCCGCSQEETWDADILCLSTRVASHDGPETGKPFFKKHFADLKDGLDRDSGFSSSEYTCGIGGFAARKGDINENDVRDIIQTYVYRGGNGNWLIRADFTTHNGRNETWEADLLCASNDIASAAGKAIAKPVFFQTLPNMARDRADVATTVNTNEYVCGVVGFAARNGDVDEKCDDGQYSPNKPIIQSFLYTTLNDSYWHFRGDFRSHKTNEYWTDVRLLCLAKDGKAPSPPVLWSRAMGSTASDIGEGVEIDRAGDVVVTGLFTGTVDFGGTTLTSLGGQDLFLGKYSARHGRRSWVSGFGGPSADIGFRVAVDATNNIGVIGLFQGVSSFGSGALTSAGSWDAFIGKYTFAGAPLWSRRFGGVESDSVGRLNFDASGNLVTAGVFRGAATFSDGSSLTSAGLDDIYVAKFGPSGARVSAQSFGGPGIDAGRGVAIDSAGNVVTVGAFSGTVGFGGQALTSAGGQDVAVAKHTSSGAHLWSFGFGGTGSDQPWDSAVDAAGNVIVVGSFTGEANFGSGTLRSAGGEDVFLAKYASDGRPLWSKRVGGSGNDRSYALALDRSGNPVVAGYFERQVDFGLGPRTSAGGRDVFVAAYSAATGYPLWSTTYGGVGSDQAIDVATDSTSVVLTGSFEGSFDLGPTRLTSAGTQDVFLAKLGPVPSNRIPSVKLTANGVPPGPVVYVTPGTPLVVSVQASDADLDWLEIRAFGVPPGAVFTNIRKGPPAIPSGIANVSGFLEWTPTLSQTGAYALSFRVTDQFGGAIQAQVTVLVCQSPGSPECGPAGAGQIVLQ